MNFPFSLSLILPAFNEEKNIANIIASSVEILQREFYDYEIVVVNDGSTDDTQNIVESLSKKYGVIRLLSHSKNQGYGAAIRSGLRAAKKDVICFMDADGQFDISQITILADYMRDFDAVIGCRKNRADNILRVIAGRSWTMLVRVILNLKIIDLNCGFKMFKKSIIEKINIVSTGALINAEILYKAIMNGAKIKQIFVTHYPRQHGTQTGLRINVIIKAIIELILFKLNKL